MNWITCTNLLPEIDQWVLIWNGVEVRISRRISDQNYGVGWTWSDGLTEIVGPDEALSWMPLPEPPRTE